MLKKTGTMAGICAADMLCQVGFCTADSVDILFSAGIRADMLCCAGIRAADNADMLFCAGIRAADSAVVCVRKLRRAAVRWFAGALQ